MPVLPAKFVNISTALATKYGPVNVIGVVVDVWGGAFKSQGTSLCITFTIKDTNLNNGHTWDGLKIKYFKETESLLPPVREGDVILLRDLAVRVVNGRLMGVAAQDRNIPWAVFRPDRDPTSQYSALSGPVPFDPSYAEKTYAFSLLEASPTTFRTASSSGAVLAPSTFSGPSQRKFALLKDIQERQFVDLVGEIVKLHSGDFEKATLYLTDYTANDKLFRYESDGDDKATEHGRDGDPYNYIPRSKKNWDGPSGQMTIQITLWEPHASFVRGNFDRHDLIRLKNVRIRGSRIDGLLEGILHTDKENPRAVHAFRIDTKNDVRVQQLLSRKEEYWKTNHAKRKPTKDPEPPSKKLSSKKQRTKPPPKKEHGQQSLEQTTRNPTNPNVQSYQAGVTIRPLEVIVNNPSHNNKSPDGIEYRLPFQNLCYRSTVHVVDFFPPNLEDFAVPIHHNPPAPGSSQQHPFTKWEWRFCLLVESVPPPPPGQRKERVKLLVSDSDAVYLLKMDAANLRAHPSKLAALKEKLFLLWGNLQERKTKAIEDPTGCPLDSGSVSSLPFTCCIKEYGVRCHHPVTDNDNDPLPCGDRDCFGWERKFGMFMTVIHDG
ncbi:hypothetical protein P175DRAFT_055008 [Aspergillus ochraceoroseus IBT 24754]|uniref:Protection of telomeres protein 1 n=1 Tax=Aspergillus ochraceoroseus IBT 24754 TaxID=1392256 RepID=A0A2T5M8N6_9EURO|nr:uncharacterized protein P175DRAFT_055008 [Aspergillus ochraceoroseus IBT 24754]PTU24890.1 hypothetical protein P175DRAFT_055008 [Aspergillus ochraceoroseus IBT 24754]